MAYKTKDLYQKSINAIEENELFFVEDVIAYLPCSKPTFYDHFGPESNELNDLKEKLETNKIKKKVQLRKKLAEGKGAAEILSLYRLIATDYERKALSTSYHDLTSKGESINAKVDLSKLSDATLKELELHLAGSKNGKG